MTREQPIGADHPVFDPVRVSDLAEALFRRSNDRELRTDGGTSPEQTAAFEITFGCSNCGAGWAEQYPTRTVIREEYGPVTALNKDCDNLGTNACDCCQTIGCPTCELHRGVFVDDRSPIDNADSAELLTDGGTGDQAPDPRYREDCLPGSVVARDLYPREEIHERIRKHAGERWPDMLKSCGIDPADLDVRWCMIEDGVISYKVTHPRMPTIAHETLPRTGGETETVAESGTDRDRAGIEDPDREVAWLGEIESLEVRDSTKGPLLALHGPERSAVAVVADPHYVDGLARAGVELEALLDGDSDV